MRRLDAACEVNPEDVEERSESRDSYVHTTSVGARASMFVLVVPLHALGEACVSPLIDHPLLL